MLYIQAAEKHAEQEWQWLNGDKSTGSSVVVEQ
jgi:hypothetical protein